MRFFLVYFFLGLGILMPALVCAQDYNMSGHKCQLWAKEHFAAVET